MDTDSARAEAAWISAFARHAAESEAFYNTLDQEAGDGDFGTNLALGGRLTQQQLSTHSRRPLASITDVFLNHIGGSSGPLFGLLFDHIERCTRDRMDVTAVARGVDGGRDAIARIGHAVVGDKTMIDALAPIAEALNTAGTADLGDALALAATAGRPGAEATRGYRGHRGRSSYAGQHGVGAIDPGALAISRLFELAADSF